VFWRHCNPSRNAELLVYWHNITSQKTYISKTTPFVLVVDFKGVSSGVPFITFPTLLHILMYYIVGHKFHKFTPSIIPFCVSPPGQLVLFTHMLALITVAINKHFGLADRGERVKGSKLNRKRGTPSTFIPTTHGNPFPWPNYIAVCNRTQCTKPCKASIKIAGLSGGKTWI